MLGAESFDVIHFNNGLHGIGAVSEKEYAEFLPQMLAHIRKLAPKAIQLLDDAGFDQVAIMAYAAKYASALYGPFRDAVDVSIVGGGDRKAYQQDYANVRESLEEIRADIAEGADMIMVKPAVTYLDVLTRARAITDLPLAAYHVSGEYSMIKAAAANGWIDGDAVALEQLTAVKRAGADAILTYFAKEAAAWLS